MGGPGQEKLKTILPYNIFRLSLVFRALDLWEWDKPAVRREVRL